MKDIERYRRLLVRKVQREREAMTRLRRAQTLYDKAYSTRLYVQDQIFAIETEVQRVIDRLEDSK